MIRQGQRLFSVPVEEVAFFFSRNRLSFHKTHDGHEWMVDYSMDELDRMPDGRRFFRLNRKEELPAGTKGWKKHWSYGRPEQEVGIGKW